MRGSSHAEEPEQGLCSRGWRPGVLGSRTPPRLEGPAAQDQPKLSPSRGWMFPPRHRLLCRQMGLSLDMQDNRTKIHPLRCRNDQRVLQQSGRGGRRPGEQVWAVQQLSRPAAWLTHLRWRNPRLWLQVYSGASDPPGTWNN